LDLTGWKSRLTNAVELITNGRLGIRTSGQAEQGRSFFYKGITDSIEIFSEVLNKGDLSDILLAETLFLTKELSGADTDETHAIQSYETALVQCDDALFCLNLLSTPEQYKIVNSAISHSVKCRHKDMPKDGFLVFMLGHPTRLRNGLKMIGIDPDERELRQLRISMCYRAAKLYVEKQKVILHPPT
jgi:hypothetical protein